MSKLASVWVLSEKKESLFELCSGADKIGAAVTALFIGSEEAIAGFDAADSVYCLGNYREDQTIVDVLSTIVQLVAVEKPDALLLDASKNSRLIAGYLGAKLKTNVLSDSLDIVSDDGVLATRMVYGGAALRKERASATAVVIVATGMFEVMNLSKAGTVRTVTQLASSSKIVRIGRREKSEELTNLAQAKCIVGVGRGFAREGSLDAAYEFAKVIGAEIGCTRPIAEEEEWLPKSRYIGISGVTCKPDLYVSLGISGQIQHMTGVSDAKTIIAINKDKNALIFKQSDYGLVADLEIVLPLLTEMLS
jgi:electron transfer flavoprotein alpha subunit